MTLIVNTQIKRTKGTEVKMFHSLQIGFEGKSTRECLLFFISQAFNTLFLHSRRRCSVVCCHPSWDEDPKIIWSVISDHWSASRFRVARWRCVGGRLSRINQSSDRQTETDRTETDWWTDRLTRTDWSRLVSVNSSHELTLPYLRT